MASSFLAATRLGISAILMASFATGYGVSARASKGPAGKFLDARDGQTYPTVVIGHQTWLARDLSWEAPDSHCYDARSECADSDRLYTWSVAVGACPQGWRLPTDEDWHVLEAYLGMPVAELEALGFRGQDQGAQLRIGGSTGFDAPIAGYRRPTGEFVRRDERSAYWTATEADESSAWHRDIRSADGRIYRSAVPKDYALSVRCLEKRSAEGR